jgi:hypothetical protein
VAKELSTRSEGKGETRRMRKIPRVGVVVVMVFVVVLFVYKES